MREAGKGAPYFPDLLVGVFLCFQDGDPGSLFFREVLNPTALYVAGPDSFHFFVSCVFY